MNNTHKNIVTYSEIDAVDIKHIGDNYLILSNHLSRYILRSSYMDFNSKIEFIETKRFSNFELFHKLNNMVCGSLFIRRAIKYILYKKREVLEETPYDIISISLDTFGRLHILFKIKTNTINQHMEYILSSLFKFSKNIDSDGDIINDKINLIDLCLDEINSFSFEYSLKNENIINRADRIKNLLVKLKNDL